MDFKEFIGIDVSKLTIDACIHSSQDVNVFENNSKGYKKLIKWIEKNSSFNLKNTIVVFEHTGLYSYNLSVFCEDNKLSFVALPGLEIKQSMGMVRGKTDEVDARRIALYGYRRRDELTPSKLQCKQLTKIKQVRVRDIDGSAKIEVDKKMICVFDHVVMKQITQKLKMLGFISVEVDPEGYKPGKINMIAD